MLWFAGSLLCTGTTPSSSEQEGFQREGKQISSRDTTSGVCLSSVLPMLIIPRRRCARTWLLLPRTRTHNF